MGSYIYLVLAHNSGGLHKIGKTVNIERRMRELKASYRNRICVIDLPSEEVMNVVERNLHDRFRSVRIPQSEMFNLSTKQVEDCKRLMKGYEKRYAPPPLTAEEIAEQAKKRRRKADDQEREYFERIKREREIRNGQSAKQEGSRAEERRDNKRWACNYFLNSIFPLIGFSTVAYAFAYFGVQWALIWAVFFIAVYAILRCLSSNPK